MFNNWLLFLRNIDKLEFKRFGFLDSNLLNDRRFFKAKLLRIFFFRNNLILFSLSGSHEDIAPNFLAKAIVVTINKSKEGNVVSWGRRSGHINCDINFLAWKHNFAQSLR